MTATFAGRPIATVRPSFPVRLLDKYFYFSMSLLIAAVVVAGFSRTVNQRLFHPAVPPPSVLWVHGVVFSAWVLFFILQSALVRIRKVRWHRTMGWFGVALGATVFILGVTTTIVMHRFLYFQLHRETAIRSISIPLWDIVLRWHIWAGDHVAHEAGVSPAPDACGYVRADGGGVRAAAPFLSVRKGVLCGSGCADSAGG